MRILTLDNTQKELDLVGKSIKETHYSVFSVNNKADRFFDYYFKKLVFLEQFESVGVHLRIGGHNVVLPANWSIIVGDRDTTDVEIVPIDETNDRGFTALSINPLLSTTPSFLEIEMVDIFPDMSWNTPKMDVHNFLVTPLPENYQNLSILIIDERNQKKIPRLEFSDLI